jgi:hypothetical protein
VRRSTSEKASTSQALGQLRALRKPLAKRHDGVLPRNVVTLSPRLLSLPTRRNRELRQRIEGIAVERYRARVENSPDRIEMEFPKEMGGRAAKNEVMQALDAAEPKWRRVFVLYPTESSLRDKGE